MYPGLLTLGSSYALRLPILTDSGLCRVRPRSQLRTSGGFYRASLGVHGLSMHWIEIVTALVGLPSVTPPGTWV